MSNIMLIGFDTLKAENLGDKIRILMKERGETDFVVTIIQAKTRMGSDSGTAAPYAVVRGTNLTTAREIAEVINFELSLDVEVEAIHSFLAKPKRK